MAAFSKPRSPLGLLPMLFALVVLIQAVVALNPAHSSPDAMRAHFEETKRELEARQKQTTWLSGRYLQIQGINRNSPAERKEIRELEKDSEAWNLYLLGMDVFMRKKQTDKVGFYQIAGVHGRPFVSWNNFGDLRNTAGFCPHGANLFGTWHRPYLAVFEQAWWLCVQESINTFPASKRESLRNTAKNLRMPYWDWAAYPGRGQPVVPRSMRDEYVTVTKASGRVTIRNPLHSYSFGSSLPLEMGGGPKNSPRTLRRPPINGGAVSNNDEMNTKFTSLRVSLRDRIYNLFAARPVPSWGAVSTSSIGARPAGGNSVDSLESIHDAIHNTAGGEGGGHMYYLDYSAFDPLFWLHHTNVDRLLAMYQTTTKNTHVMSGSVPRAMAQWNRGEVKTESSALQPFTKNLNGNYLTSADAKWTRPYGYYYPETKTNKAQDVYNFVTSLYGPNAKVSKRHTHHPRHVAELSTKYEGRPFTEGEENYVLSVVADKYAIAGSYAVHCFIGSPSKSSNATTTYQANSTASAPCPTGTGSASSPYTNSTEDLTEHPDYAGSYAVLGGSHTGESLMTEGALPISTCLQGKHAAGELASLKREDVEPYLKEHLYYKIIGPNGVEISADELPDLHIGIKSCPVTPAENPYDMPSFGNYVNLPECTKGKPAGEPYTHELKPIEELTPGPAGPSEDEDPFENEPYYPIEPETPADEEGQCVMHQTVKYVDPAGNFLYEETS